LPAGRPFVAARSWQRRMPGSAAGPFEELVGEEDPQERKSSPLCVRSWEDTRTSHDETAGPSVKNRGSPADGPREEPHTEVGRPWTTLRVSVWTCTRRPSRWLRSDRARRSPTNGLSRTPRRPSAHTSAVTATRPDSSPATKPVPPATTLTAS
jgi:hypothetical protein